MAENISDGQKFVLLLAEAMTVVSALLVALHPNILYAAIALLFTFMGVAGMFVFAGADFIAGVQVIVYVGGITILILFAIMLTQWMYRVSLRDVERRRLLPLVIGAAVFLPSLLAALHELTLRVKPLSAEKLAEFTATPKTQAIGQLLLGPYVLPFEAITILLLGALVGGVWLARPAK